MPRVWRGSAVLLEGICEHVRGTSGCPRRRRQLAEQRRCCGAAPPNRSNSRVIALQDCALDRRDASRQVTPDNGVVARARRRSRWQLRERQPRQSFRVECGIVIRLETAIGSLPVLRMAGPQLSFRSTRRGSCLPCLDLSYCEDSFGLAFSRQAMNCCSNFSFSACC